MIKQQHASNNGVLGAPEGMSIDKCGALPVTKLTFTDGVPGWASFWRPTEQELKALAGGAFVRVTVIGGTHPPIALGVDGDGELSPIS